MTIGSELLNVRPIHKLVLKIFDLHSFVVSPAFLHINQNLLQLEKTTLMSDWQILRATPSFLHIFSVIKATHRKKAHVR